MSFLFPLLCKIGEQEGGTGPALGGGTLIPVEEGKRWGKGVRGFIGYIYCVHMNVNGKKISVETISQMGEGGIKNDKLKFYL
jgi:hypothetical protein